MSFQHWLEFVGYLGARAAVRHLPHVPVQQLGGRLARAAYDRGGRRSGYARVNLRVAFPELSERERDEIGRDSFAQGAYNIVDLLRGDQWSDAQVRERVSVHGLDLLLQSLAGGRGAFGLGLHMGNFELAGRRISLEVPATVVGRPLKNARIYQRVVDQRQKSGGEVLSHRSSVRGIMRALKAGRFVGVFNDQYARGSRGVLSSFFNARCPTGAGLALLALRTGVPVVPFYTLREASDRHSVHFNKPLYARSSGDRSEDIARTTATYNTVLEQIIRRHPEQWLWAHRRFRKSPDLPDQPYA